MGAACPRLSSCPEIRALREMAPGCSSTPSPVALLSSSSWERVRGVRVGEGVGVGEGEGEGVGVGEGEHDCPALFWAAVATHIR